MDPSLTCRLGRPLTSLHLTLLDVVTTHSPAPVTRSSVVPANRLQVTCVSS